MLLKRYLLVGLVLFVLVSCTNKGDTSAQPSQEEETEEWTPGASSVFPQPDGPSVDNVPDGSNVGNVPEDLGPAPVSLLTVIDESASVHNCSPIQQEMRHSVPEFFMSLTQNMLNVKLKTAVSVFNAETPYRQITSFEQELGNSTDWFQKIEEEKLSDKLGENFSTLMNKGLEDLKATAADSKQILLLLTDGIYVQDQEIEKVKETINTNLNRNQRIIILILCPDKMNHDNFWEQIDKDKDQIETFRTDSPDWLKKLTESIVDDDRQFQADIIEWVSSNDKYSFEAPSNFDFKITAVSLFQDGVGVSLGNQKLNQGLAPNSFSYFQEANPADDCGPLQMTIVNHTKGDMLFWVNKEKVDVVLKTEFVSQPNEKPVKLATIMAIPQKSNADLLNLLSCYKPLLEVKKGMDKPQIFPEKGNCSEGLCMEPSRLISYWTWNEARPPILETYAILDRTTQQIVFKANSADLIPPPYIYDFSIEGPDAAKEGSSKPYLSANFDIWASDNDIREMRIYAFTDLDEDDLVKVGQNRKNEHSAPLCPRADAQIGYQVNAESLSNDNQIVYAISSDSDKELSYTLKIKILQIVGWSTSDDRDASENSDNLLYCGYSKFHIVFENITWECDMKQMRCEKENGKR